MDLTHKDWQLVAPLLPETPSGTRGRPWRDAREVLNGILWVLRTRAAWADLPARYPPYQTCHRRYLQWQEEGTLARILRVLPSEPLVLGRRLRELREQAGLTVGQLASVLARSPGYVSRVEVRGEVPAAPLLCAWCKVLGADKPLAVEVFQLARVAKLTQVEHDIDERHRAALARWRQQTEA